MSFTQGSIISPTEPINIANTSYMGIKNSITIDGISRDVLYINGFPNEPSSDESLSLFYTFPSCPATLPRGTASPDQPLFNPSKASPSSASTQSTDLLRHYRPPKPPHLAGAMDDDAPHRRGTPATEDGNLNSEGAHTDSASAAPPRDDNLGGSGSSQDDRLLHRRTPLDKVAPDAPRRPTTRRPSTRRATSFTPPRSIAYLPSMHMGGPPGPTVASSRPPRPALPPAGRPPQHRADHAMVADRNGPNN